jgi:hypothetical protein
MMPVEATPISSIGAGRYTRFAAVGGDRVLMG